MNATEESLKTTRFIHRATMTVFFALLIVALSPNETARYEAALREMDTIITMDLRAYKNLQRAKIDSQIDLKDQMDAVTESAQQAGLDIKPGSLSRKPSEYVDFALPPSRYFTLDEYDKRIRSLKSRLLVFVPDSAAVESHLSDSFKKVVADSDQHDYYLDHIRWSPEQPVYDLAPSHTSIDGRVIPYVYCRMHPDEVVGVEDVFVSGRVLKVCSMSLIEWMRRQDNLQSLIQTRHGRDILFPRLKAVWNEVRTKERDEAVDTLQERLLSQHRDVSFFGILIPESLILVVGPFAGLAILLHLSVHVRHLLRLVTSGSTDTTAFPWIGMFSDRLSRMVTYCSLIGLPGAANALLLYRSWLPFSWVQWIWALFTSVLAIVIGIYICRMVQRLSLASPEHRN